jgi:hypothetical protein
MSNSNGDNLLIGESICSCPIEIFAYFYRHNIATAACHGNIRIANHHIPFLLYRGLNRPPVIEPPHALPLQITHFRSCDVLSLYIGRSIYWVTHTIPNSRRGEHNFKSLFKRTYEVDIYA